MQLIDGKRISGEIFAELTDSVAKLKAEHGVQPGLAVVLIGNDPASEVYVRTKSKRSIELGINSFKYELPADSTQEAVLNLVAELNANPDVNGILVQSPPPKHIDERAVIEAIDPAKDVDCFHPVSVGKLLIGDDDGYYPCTPHGVMELLRRYDIETSGKHAVVLGRSNIVGKPMAVLLSRKAKPGDCTVTICHSRTRNLPAVCATADILVAAIGRPEMVTADYVKDGAVVIDVGINRVDDPGKKKGYRLCGDVAFDEVAPKCSYITPVPGGVGPMTIAMLMTNAVKACCRQNGIAVADILGY